MNSSQRAAATRQPIFQQETEKMPNDQWKSHKSDSGMPCVSQLVRYFFFETLLL